MKKVIWALVLIGLVGVASAAAWRWWKLSQANALPTGIVSGNGRIESVQVDVAAKYGGRIKEILAREGDLVEEGQVLVTMNTDELEAELAKDKAKLAESEEAAAEVKTEITKDESQLKLADMEFKRSKSLARTQGRLAGGVRPVQDPPGHGEGLTRRVQGQAEDGEPVHQRGRGGSEADGGEDRGCHPQIAGQGAGPLPARRAGRGRPLGGKVLTLVNLGDVYMEIYLPAQEAARVKIGADARIVLDARPEYAAQAKVSYVSPEAQFTPKQVETRSERDKLMFRVKLQVPPELVLPYIERIKTGVRGMGYVRLDDTVAWPAFLERSFPPKP